MDILDFAKVKSGLIDIPQLGVAIKQFKAASIKYARVDRHTNKVLGIAEFPELLITLTQPLNPDVKWYYIDGVFVEAPRADVVADLEEAHIDKVFEVRVVPNEKLSGWAQGLPDQYEIEIMKAELTTIKDVETGKEQETYMLKPHQNFRLDKQFKPDANGVIIMPIQLNEEGFYRIRVCGPDPWCGDAVNVHVKGRKNTKQK